MTLDGVKWEASKNTLPLDFQRMDWEFESVSEPGLFHLVTVGRKTGDLACDCKGFYYKMDCWHVRRVHSQRLMAKRGYQLQEADTERVTQASKYAFVILVPRVRLGEADTVEKLATIVYDLLKLGITIEEIRNWFTFLPLSWTQEAVEKFVSEHGRREYISSGGNNITGQAPGGQS